MEFLDPENRTIIRSQLIMLGFFNCDEIMNTAKELILQAGQEARTAVMYSMDKTVFPVESEFSLRMMDGNWTLQHVTARMDSHLPFLQDGIVSVKKMLNEGDLNLTTKKQIFSGLRTSLTSRILVAIPGLELELLSLGFEEELRNLQFYSYSLYQAKFELRITLPPDTGNIRFIHLMIEAQLGQDAGNPFITQMGVTRFTWDEPEDSALFHKTHRMPSLGEIVDAYNLTFLKESIIHQARSHNITGSQPGAETKIDTGTTPRFRL